MHLKLLYVFVHELTILLHFDIAIALLDVHVVM